MTTPGTLMPYRPSNRDMTLPATLLCLLLALNLAGCAATGKVKEAIGKAAEAVGMKTPAAETGPIKVPLRIFAGENLNAGSGNRPIALVLKVYQLRDSNAFEQTGYNQFLDAAKEKTALGDDLISSHEVLVLPGQSYDLVETTQPTAAYIGVVALFQAPTSSRWRLSFESKGSQKKGISVGVHACAMTTTDGLLVSKLAGDPGSLSTVNCTANR
jgi:type VI secretion system protein VasD